MSYEFPSMKANNALHDALKAAFDAGWSACVSAASNEPNASDTTDGAWEQCEIKKTYDRQVTHQMAYPNGASAVASGNGSAM